MIQRENKVAFTLVELIIIITILAILATIAFVSFQEHIKDSRDAHRVTTIKNIENGLQAFQTTTGNYPEPENYTLIQASGTTVSYQGYIADSISKQIKINKTPLDPLDQTKFMYSTSVQKQKYQLLSYFENANQLSTLFQTYASAHYQRQLITYGKGVGILLNQENSSLPSTQIDILKNQSGSIYKAIFLNNDIILGSGNNLFSNIYNRRTDLLQNRVLAKLDESLVLYFDMENFTSSGGWKVIQDLSQYQNHGFCYEGGSSPQNCGESLLGPQFIHTKNGKKLYLDGNSDWVNISTTPFYQLPLKNFTISAVISTVDKNMQRYIVNTSGNGGAGFRYGLVSSGKLGFLYGSSVSGYVEKDISTSEVYTNGNSYLFTMKFILNDKVESYINGNLIATDSIVGKGYSGALNSIQSFWIGRMGNNYFHGNIDELRIYNRDLHQNEIKELYSDVISR